MDFDNTIDIDSLLLPISEKAPTGVNIRRDASSDSIYYQIKDARNRARTIERQQMQGVSSLQATSEWLKVYQLALKILAQYSKDMEVCAWFIEALVRLDNFSGLHRGLNFMRRLSEKFWDALHPQADEEGLQTRLAIINGLSGDAADGVLITPIANIKLTHGKTTDSFALWEYQQASEVNLITDVDKRQKRLNEGAVNLSLVEASALETEAVFFRAISTDLQGCINELEQLTQFFDSSCGADSPSLSKIRNVIVSCLDTVKILGKSAFSNLPDLDENVADNPAGSDIEMKNKDSSTINREKAFNLISQAADYFQQNEPHSPLSYVLKKAVRWGHMSLPNLLEEIIKDTNVLKQFYALTGIEEVNN